MRLNLNKTDKVHDFKPGWVGTISGYKNDELAKHLMSIGLTIGKEVTVLSKSPFGKTYRVEIKHRSVALRVTELQALEFNID